MVRLKPDTTTAIVVSGFSRTYRVADDHQSRDDSHRGDSRDGVLHESGAGAGPCRRSGRRHLGLGLRAVRDARGRRAFDGADTTDVIAAVVRAEPEWSRLPPRRRRVRRLLRRCLEKDPRRRLADIRDARFTLEDLAKEPDAAAPLRCHISRERFLWAAALLLCIAGSTALFWRGSATAPSATRDARGDHDASND